MQHVFSITDFLQRIDVYFVQKLNFGALAIFIITCTKEYNEKHSNVVSNQTSAFLTLFFEFVQYEKRLVSSAKKARLVSSSEKFNCNYCNSKFNYKVNLFGQLANDENNI